MASPRLTVKRGKSVYYIIKDKQIPSFTYWYKKTRKALIKAFGGKCFKCGRTKKLQFAHYIPTGLEGRGRGRWERVHDVMQNPDCYGLLCERCHREYDANHSNR